MFGKKTCPGCCEKIDTKGDDCVKFKIMAKNITTTRMVYRKEKIEICLHRKCLAENIWIIVHYYESTTNYADIEIEVRIRGELFRYQVMYDKNEWQFKIRLENGNEMKWNREVKNMFTELMLRKDMTFVMYNRNKSRFPPILTSNSDPLISEHISNPEYIKFTENVKKRFRKVFQWNEELEVDTEIILSSQITFALLCAVVIEV